MRKGRLEQGTGFSDAHTPGLLVSPQPDWRTSDDTLRCTGYGMQDVSKSVHDSDLKEVYYYYSLLLLLT